MDSHAEMAREEWGPEMIQWYWLLVAIIPTAVLAFMFGVKMGARAVEDFVTMSHIHRTVPPEQITIFRPEKSDD